MELQRLLLFALLPVGIGAQALSPPEHVGNTFYVDSFPSACAVAGRHYTTQADCAWATASDFVTAASGQYGALLVFTSNYYQKKVEWAEPSTTKGQAVSLKGSGMNATYIIQVASLPASPMISSPNQGGNLATFDITDLTLVANGNANSCADLVDIISNNIRAVNCTGVIDGSDHDWQIGAPGRNAQEVVMDHVFASGISNAAARAEVNATVSGGIPRFSVTSGGTGYPDSNTDIGVFLTGTGHGDHPCSSMGTSTASVSAAGVITAIRSTATGCVAPVYVQVYPVSKIAAGFRLYMSDSTGYDLFPQGMQLGIDLEFGNTTLIHPHPTNVPIGIRVTQNDDLDKVECDTVGLWCIDFEGKTPVTVEHTNGYTGLAASIPGNATFHFGAGAGPAEIVGVSNLCEAGLPAGYHEILTASGPYPSRPLPPGTDVLANDPACGTPLGDIITQAITIGNLTITGGAASTPAQPTNSENRLPLQGRSSSEHGDAEMGSARHVLITSDGMTQLPVGSAIASASTIAPTDPTTHITGKGVISRITRPLGCGVSMGYSCTITLISDEGFSLATGGNIAAAETTTSGHSYRLTYDQATSQWYPQ